MIPASAFILLNGSPIPPFKLHRGHRQGDPLSPILFNLVMETLNLLLMKGAKMKLWDGISLKENGIMVSHFQYADDAIIFSPPKMDALLNIKKGPCCSILSLDFALTFTKIRSLASI